MAKRSRRATKKRYAVSQFAGRRITRRPAFLFQALLAQDTPAAKKIDLIRSGVSARVVDDMVAYLHVPKNDIFKLLCTPESTAHKLIKDNRPLDPGASERVVRVAEITKTAEETFGGREAAAQWLKTPNLALKAATPLSMLDTEPGAREVRRILSAITHGGVF
jgi:putative toxin-antitoxin system antitoxin component (TIGR02293 family)